MRVRIKARNGAQATTSTTSHSIQFDDRHPALSNFPYHLHVATSLRMPYSLSLERTGRRVKQNSGTCMRTALCTVLSPNVITRSDTDEDSSFLIQMGVCMVDSEDVALLPESFANRAAHSNRDCPGKEVTRCLGLPPPSSIYSIPVAGGVPQHFRWRISLNSFRRGN